MIHSAQRGEFSVSSCDHALVNVLITCIFKQGGACLCVFKVLNFQ